MCFFLSHSFVALAVCFGSLSCCNTHPRPIFNALAGFNALALTVHGPVHRPLDAVQLSCPFSRKTPPKHNVSTSMFDGGDGVLQNQNQNQALFAKCAQTHKEFVVVLRSSWYIHAYIHTYIHTYIHIYIHI